MQITLENLKLLPIYFLFLGTFGQASAEKLLSGGVPEWFQKQFGGTKFNAFPGALALNYYGIALLELAVVALFLFSAGSLEFLAGHDKSVLKAALLLALFTFFALGFGLRMTGDFQGAANLFMYFGVCFLLFAYVDRVYS